MRCQQRALVVESLDGVIETLGEFLLLATRVVWDGVVLNGCGALRAGVGRLDELLAGVHIAAARDGDVALVAEIELIVLETEEPAALTGGRHDVQCFSL